MSNRDYQKVEFTEEIRDGKLVVFGEKYRVEIAVFDKSEGVKGFPFYIVGEEWKYPTVERAVDAARSIIRGKIRDEPVDVEAARRDLEEWVKCRKVRG